MTKTQEEFYKTFDIPLVHHYLYSVYMKWSTKNCYNEPITMDREYKGLKKQALLNKYNNRKYIKFKVSNVKPVLNLITAEKILKLIVVLSGVMPVNFAFERGIDDIKKRVLEYAIAYKEKNTNHFYDIDNEVKQIIENE